MKPFWVGNRLWEGNRKSPNDRGQSSVVLIVVIPGLLFVTLLVISILAGGVVEARQATNAADSASLAAAEKWRKAAAQSIETAQHASTAKGQLRALSALLHSTPASWNATAVCDEAKRYANDNNNHQLSCVPMNYSDGLRVKVRTRHKEYVTDTKTRPESEATSQLTPVQGLRISGSTIYVHTKELGYITYAQFDRYANPSPPPAASTTTAPSGEPPSPPPPPPPPSPLKIYDLKVNIHIAE